MSTVSPDLVPSAPFNSPNPRRRLIVGNAMLLAILAGVTLLNTRFAGAQPERAPSGGRDGGGARLRGEYTMVSGRTQGVTTSTIYVIDAVSQEIVAINWDRNTSKPEVIGLRSLAEDSRFLQRAR